MLSRFRKWNFKQNFETEHSFHQSVLFKPLPFPLEKHNLEAFPPLEGILEKKKKGNKREEELPTPSLLTAPTRFNKISFLRGAFD